MQALLSASPRVLLLLVLPPPLLHNNYTLNGHGATKPDTYSDIQSARSASFRSIGSSIGGGGVGGGGV